MRAPADGKHTLYTVVIKAGKKRAIAEGATVGRPKGKQAQKTLDRMARVKELRAEGRSFARIGEQLGISRQRAAQLFDMV